MIKKIPVYIIVTLVGAFLGALISAFSLYYWALSPSDPGVSLAMTIGIVAGASGGLYSMELLRLRKNEKKQHDAEI